MSDMNFTLVSHNGHFSGPAYRRELDEAIARRDREQASLQAAVLEQRRQRIEARQLSGPVVAETQEATQFMDQTFDFPRLWADFFDLYTPHGDWWFGGGTSKQDRKHGRMWPFYRNENELNWLRAMSRFVAGWNGGQAGGFVGGLCGYVVGKGMVPKCVPADGTLDPQDKLLCKAVDRVLQNFYDQELFPGVKFTEYQQHVFNQTLIDGDSYTWMFDVGDHLTLRPVWPELITQPSGGTFEEWGFGHHTHPDDTLHVVAYHVASGDGTDGTGVDAADMVHIPFFRPGGWTPGIKRGLPLFSFGVKESIDAAGKLVRNMTEGEAIRQAIAYIEQQAAMTERSQALEFDTNRADVVMPHSINANRRIPSIKAVPGYVPKIPQGYEYQAPPSAQTSPAIEVVDCALRAAGQIFNAPAWLVGASGRDQAAYSSDLVHEAPFVKRVEACQEFFGNRFLAILYRVVNIAVRNGLLPPDTLRRVRLTMEYPAVVSRDAAEETQSNTAYIEAKVKSVQQVQQELSLDPEKIRHEIEEFAAWGQQQQPAAPGQPGQQPQQPSAAGAQESSQVMESGFTGVKNDSLGRKMYYSDGEHVASPTPEEKQAIEKAGGDTTTNDSTKEQPQVDVNGLHKQLAAEMPDLDEDHFEAMGDYTSGAYNEINASLREGRQANKGAKAIPLIESAIKSAPVLKEPISVYRGVRFNAEQSKAFLANAEAAAKSGGVMQDPAFVSSTIDPGIATKWATGGSGAEAPIVMQIQAKHGLYIGASAGGSKEKEFVMQHGSKFKVLGVEDKGTHKVVKLEQVL